MGLARVYGRRGSRHVGLGRQPTRRQLQGLPGTLPAAADCAISVRPAEQSKGRGLLQLSPKPPPGCFTQSGPPAAFPGLGQVGGPLPQGLAPESGLGLVHKGCQLEHLSSQIP